VGQAEEPRVHVGAVIGGQFDEFDRTDFAIGLHQNAEPGKAPLLRQIGVILTWLIMLVCAGLLILAVIAG
jgi:hypothetical protein